VQAVLDVFLCLGGGGARQESRSPMLCTVRLQPLQCGRPSLERLLPSGAVLAMEYAGICLRAAPVCSPGRATALATLCPYAPRLRAPAPLLPMQDCLALGAILAATDSVATLQVISQGRFPLLYSLVFGEGVINDATSIVVLGTIKARTRGQGRGGGGVPGRLCGAVCLPPAAPPGPHFHLGRSRFSLPRGLCFAVYPHGDTNRGNRYPLLGHGPSAMAVEVILHPPPVGAPPSSPGLPPERGQRPVLGAGGARLCRLPLPLRLLHAARDGLRAGHCLPAAPGRL
jgi:hypothetical protein